MVPQVTSQSFSIYNKKESLLINNAALQIKFAVPSWFPLNVKCTEKQGTKSIQKNAGSRLRWYLRTSGK